MYLRGRSEYFVIHGESNNIEEQRASSYSGWGNYTHRRCARRNTRKNNNHNNTHLKNNRDKGRTEEERLNESTRVHPNATMVVLSLGITLKKDTIVSRGKH